MIFLFAVRVIKYKIMADEENVPENDLFPLETKSRGLTRTGNFRKNVRKKYRAQQSDPGSSHRDASLSAEESYAPIMKSRTMPNMPRYVSQNCLSSENNSDNSYVSLDNSPDSNRRDKTTDTTSGIREPTSTFSSFAQTTISKRIESLENISRVETLKICDETTNQSNKLITEKANDHASEEFTHEKINDSHEHFNKENISNNDSSTLDHLKSADSENGSDDSWHDAGSDLSDEDEVDYFDANEDQRVSIQNQSKWKLKLCQPI